MAATVISFLEFDDDIKLMSYIGVASLTVLAYDYLLTLPAEVKHIWVAPWNAGKILFFLIRYLVFVDTSVSIVYLAGGPLTLSRCHTLFGWFTASFTIGMALADVILALRTWAIWNNNRTWATILIVGWLCVWLPALAALAVVTQTVLFIPSPFPGRPSCLMTTGTDLFYTAYIYLFGVIVVFEACVFVATAVKGLDHLRRSRTSLLTVLYGDGLIFSGCLFVISLVNLVVISDSSSYLNVLLVLQRVMHSVLPGRIVLHLREVASRPATGSLSTTAM